MKIKNTLPKNNVNKHNELIEQGWIPLKEPSSVFAATIFSIPLMIVNTFITLGVLYLASGFSINEFLIIDNSITITINLFSLLFFLLLIFILVVVHEAIHLLCVPDFLKSEKTYAGLTFFGGYVYTEEKLSKKRFLLIMVAPFFILSILTPLVLGLFGLLNSTIILLVIFNAAASSVDVLGALIISFQVPKRATMVSNGIRSYWKS
ncbi:DUF3267 domain-containing protein [Halobacillus sp. A1]|uniref:DUF3267 domain-containing protein n=1 Tax=Halobacillus sp. A1 TaxID=2880262 RepID=UPI0020A655F1|nr:DUF3267 domain-containing protein [Halobacillus sp. A1]MCP3031907.1 DUF3267 domain-containing protein [Halobacillus sp. A1]